MLEILLELERPYEDSVETITDTNIVWRRKDIRTHLTMGIFRIYGFWRMYDSQNRGWDYGNREALIKALQSKLDELHL